MYKRQVFRRGPVIVAVIRLDQSNGFSTKYSILLFLGMDDRYPDCIDRSRHSQWYASQQRRIKLHFDRSIPSDDVNAVVFLPERRTKESNIYRRNCRFISCRLVGGADVHAFSIYVAKNVAGRDGRSATRRP